MNSSPLAICLNVIVRFLIELSLSSIIFFSKLFLSTVRDNGNSSLSLSVKYDSSLWILGSTPWLNDTINTY